MEMKEINKIVQLSDLQYEKLLKDRQIEIDGEIKVWEPDTLYVTPNNNYQWLFNKFYEAAVKPNEVYHNPMNMKSLEQEYNELVEKTPSLKFVSAIGYTAILKNGDTVKVTLPNYGDFFINGERVTNDYTYTGDGYEVVNVWCFENKDAPELNDAPLFNISELDVRNIASTPVVGDGYKNYALTIKAYNFEINGLATRKLVSNGTETFNQKSISTTTEQVESDCITVGTGLNGKANLKKVIMPELTTIQEISNAFLNGSTNPDLTYYIPNLAIINGSGSGDSAPFSRVANVVIPNSVRVINKIICKSNKTITLNCNRATSISSNWCMSPPTDNFAMCDDWQASINIAVAAKNHTKDWFINLFENKIHDFSSTEETREICIPLTIFEAMIEDELALAKNKNWTVTGA